MVARSEPITSFELTLETNAILAETKKTITQNNQNGTLFMTTHNFSG
jgi:hypothetical protein